MTFLHNRTLCSYWLLIAGGALWLQPNTADAFRILNRWNSTAIDGGTGAQGGPITLTWSFVPDGTAIPGGAVAGESSDNSSLIAFFDSIYPGGSGPDLTARPWFSIFDDSFTRLEELSGLTYVYEPNDDGSLMYTNNGGGSFTGGPSGSLGVRGDVRIGGHSFGGSSVLAYNFFPNAGEMVIDTNDGGFYGNTTSDSRAARNVIMHEAGHGLGIQHVESNNAAFLLEPFINTSFDGPQHDDILALHRNYGDALEKSNGGDGNNNSGDATPLGLIGDGQTESIGTDADAGTSVGSGETDFVSVDDDSDFDFFSFVVSGPSEVDLLLTPQGPTYNEGPQTNPATPQSPLDTSALSDLTLDLFDTDGTTLLGTANSTSAGSSESLTNFSLGVAGTYFARVSGADDNVQLYQLDVSVTAVPEPATYALGVLGLMAFAFVGWQLRRTG